MHALIRHIYLRAHRAPSEDNEDFDIPSVAESFFGPCDPCQAGVLIQTEFPFEVFIKDDKDLEFDHGFSLSVSSGITGIILPSTPLEFSITDNGKYRI